MKYLVIGLVFITVLSCKNNREENKNFSSENDKLLLGEALNNVRNLKSVDEEIIKGVCMNYIEGFYEGDSTKIINNLKPSLYKFGYWKNKDSGEYEGDGHMTYRQAIDYAKNVLEKKQFAKPDAPKKVEVLDIMNHIAVAKITAWWGQDYLLLSRTKNGWIIEQALWEGPLPKE